jgi:hypothetical protein
VVSGIVLKNFWGQGVCMAMWEMKYGEVTLIHGSVRRVYVRASNDVVACSRVP